MTAPSGVRRRRGEPLMALVLLLGGWTGARVMLWESPFARTASQFTNPGEKAMRQAAVSDLTLHSVAPVSIASIGSREVPRFAPDLGRIARSGILHSSTALEEAEGAAAISRPIPSIAMAGSTLLTIAPPPAPESSPPLIHPLPIIPTAGPGRWHLAACAAWRQGTGLPRVANGPRPASYGGTQIGALLQFDLANGVHRPAVHVRATHAPDRPRQSEIAAGVGIRPLAAVPVRVMGEVRATRSLGQVDVRPALLAVTELPPAELPLKLTVEGYAQGGWVGGSYATAFADGQVRATREIFAAGPARLHLGAGAWGGTQKFASRLDVGPTVAVDLGRGAVSARLSIDYRMRVAGNASPGDGVAVTLSTGF